MARQPDTPPPPPVVQRLRIRYAKRGRLRFTSHRDFARAFERALRRAAVPMAYSAGFTPHPKVSYAGAAPTGVASEAEYLEIGLAERREPEHVRTALDDALPPGLDIVEVVDGQPPSLAERIEASLWRVELRGVTVEDTQRAVVALLAASEAPVTKLTKDGHRIVDARAPLVLARVAPEVEGADCAILELVVRHETPAVRPDDVLTALRQVGALSTPVTPFVTRLAQGLLGDAPPAGTEPITLLDPLRDVDGQQLPPAAVSEPLAR
ncbi:MAG TPA: TIGR03936 family radical SAM-associated protein [Mycobacteriales bacterium]|nr:TIGR03936 family radical SAM-associated protein [Mycobacteriales bacterium]